MSSSLAEVEEQLTTEQRQRAAIEELLETERAKAIAECESLRAAMQKNEEEHTELKKEMELKGAECARLQEKVKQKEHDLDKQWEENGEYRNLLHEKVAQADDMHGQIAKLEEDLAWKAEEIRVLQASICEGKEEHSKSLLELERQVHEFKNKLDEKTKEYDQFVLASKKPPPPVPPKPIAPKPKSRPLISF